MAVRCVVIGGGVLGAATALRLAEEDAHVTVVDAKYPGSGATGSTFGWVGASHPGLHEPHEYFDLNARGVAAYRRLEIEFGEQSWFVRTGCLAWHSSADAQAGLASLVTSLREWTYSATALTPNQANRSLEPGIRFGPDVEIVGFYPDEGFAYGRPMVADLLKAARVLGAVVRTNDGVVGIRSQGTRVVGVTLVSGEEIDADIVVSACGRGTSEVVGSVGFNVPLVSPEPKGSAAVGLLVVTSPLPSPISRVLIPDDFMMRPDGGGRMMLHGWEQDELVRQDTPPIPLPAAADAVLERATEHLRDMEPVVVESVRVGVRPIPEDGLPVAGWVPGVDGLYVLVTHSGMTMGPLLGELATMEIMRGADEQVLRRFRPARFALASATASSGVVSQDVREDGLCV